jgi:hypothetical protein
MQFSEYRIKEKSLVVGQVVLGLLIIWSLLYNILIKKQHLFEAFFGIIDTLTEDLFMRAGMGLFAAIVIMIMAFFSERYAQMLSINYFFRQMEIIFAWEFEEEEPTKSLKENHSTEENQMERSNVQPQQKMMLLQVIEMEDMPVPLCNYPLSGKSALTSLATLYLFHACFLFILSEPIALLVRLNSADILINGDFVTNIAVMALSLPLSIRIMSAVGYKDTKQFANIIPFVSVLCILFICLPIAFDNMDASFLESVYNQNAFWNIFIREILLLAFIPTFLEGILWMLQIFALKEDT